MQGGGNSRKNNTAKTGLSMEETKVIRGNAEKVPSITAKKEPRHAGTLLLLVVVEILTVVELDDLLLIDILGQLSAFRQTDVFAFNSGFCILQVCRKVIAVGNRFFNGSEAAASFTQSDYVAQAYAEGSDVDFLAVNGYVTVGNQLTCACTGVGESKTVHEVVQTAFKQEHEVLARDTLHLLGFVEEGAELLLTKAVHEAQFLLLLKLHAVVADLSALVSAMLSRRERAFQVFASAAQGNAETTAEFKFRSGVTCHVIVDSF